MTKGILALSPVMLMLFLDSAGTEIVTHVLQKGSEREQILVVTAHQVVFTVIVRRQ